MSLRRCECGAFRNDTGNCPNCGRGFYEIDPATKVRRRIEDYLRKVDDDTVMRIANDLNIKLT